jgi:hypothetical protein
VAQFEIESSIGLIYFRAPIIGFGIRLARQNIRRRSLIPVPCQSTPRISAYRFARSVLLNVRVADAPSRYRPCTASHGHSSEVFSFKPFRARASVGEMPQRTSGIIPAWSYAACPRCLPRSRARSIRRCVRLGSQALSHVRAHYRPQAGKQILHRSALSVLMA